MIFKFINCYNRKWDSCKYNQYLYIGNLLRNNLNLTILQRIISQNKFIKIQFISLYLLDFWVVTACAPLTVGLIMWSFLCHLGRSHVAGSLEECQKRKKMRRKQNLRKAVSQNNVSFPKFPSAFSKFTFFSSIKYDLALLWLRTKNCQFSLV